MAGRVGRRVILALIGIGLFALWMRFSGSGGPFNQGDSIPAIVFEGGGGTLGVEFTTNQPADFVFAFEKHGETLDETQSVGGSESFTPGSYNRTIDVSAATYVYLELGVPEATPGAEINWRISIDGRQILQESDRLNEPLSSGYAFFLQVEADDIDQLRRWR